MGMLCKNIDSNFLALMYEIAAYIVKDQVNLEKAYTKGLEKLAQIEKELDCSPNTPSLQITLEKLKEEQSLLNSCYEHFKVQQKALEKLEKSWFPESTIPAKSKEKGNSLNMV